MNIAPEIGKKFNIIKMDFDVVKTFDLQDAAYSSNIRGVTVKRFLLHCGAKRTKERKTDGIWYTELKIRDRNKWFLAKIKYGI